MYKIKHDSNGNIDKFKAPYVAIGSNNLMEFNIQTLFLQQQAQNKTSKFLQASLAIKIFLMPAGVKEAYLHTKKDKEVYREQPKFEKTSRFEKLVNNGKKFAIFLIQQGFVRSKHDSVSKHQQK